MKPDPTTVPACSMTVYMPVRAAPPTYSELTSMDEPVGAALQPPEVAQYCAVTLVCAESAVTLMVRVVAPLVH